MSANATLGSTSSPIKMNTDSNTLTALERLYDDLELISYAVSHDLMMPLRMMLDTCEMLKERNGFSSDALGQETLQSLDARIRQLQVMLKAVQEYIRLETFPVTYIPLESEEILEAALAAMAEEIHTTGAAVTHDTLPRVKGHRGRLNHLFIYLLDNALKFHGEDAPRVHISAKRTGDMWEFSMQDNGIGIEEECQAIIFRLFHRLHPAEAYPGHGIGLALSQKTIASHGGSIWVESFPGQGSRFYFTLPATDT